MSNSFSVSSYKVDWSIWNVFVFPPWGNNFYLASPRFADAWFLEKDSASRVLMISSKGTYYSQTIRTYLQSRDQLKQLGLIYGFPMSPDLIGNYRSCHWEIHELSHLWTAWLHHLESVNVFLYLVSSTEYQWVAYLIGNDRIVICLSKQLHSANTHAKNISKNC